MVVGFATSIKYGYKSSGDIFLVHRKDYERNRDKFAPVHDVFDTKEDIGHIVPPPPPDSLFGESTINNEKEDNDEQGKEHSKTAKEKMLEPLSVRLLSEFGISRNVKDVYDELKKLKVDTVGLIPALTIDQLTGIKGIGKVTAKKLKENAVKYYQE